MADIRQKKYDSGFYFRMTKKERALLKKRTNESGYENESQFLRNYINYPKGQKITPEINLDIKKLINETNKIGVNINQIVKNNNSHLYTDYDKRKLFALAKQHNEILNKILEEVQL